MGGKKGGGKGKKKEQEEKDVLTEVDREYYEIQLVDRNRKLTRLRNRTCELETLNASLEEQLRKLDEDRADIIAYLKKTLMTKSDQMTQLQERLDGLKQAQESGVIMYKEQIAQMDHNFKNMHEELTAEIKLLLGKLNSLEEFRAQRDELMAKLAQQQERMTEMDRQHQETIHEAQRQIVEEKNKLKNEMERRLLELSRNFQEATDVRIASTTHKIIHENMNVNKALDTSQQVQKSMVEAFDVIKHKCDNAYRQLKLREEERDQALRKHLHQQEDIAHLKIENESLQRKLREMEEGLKDRETVQRKCQNLTDALEDANFQVKVINARCMEGQSKAAKLYADVAALKANGRRLAGILKKAVTAVQGALSIQAPNLDLDPALVSYTRHHLLLNLLELLNRATLAEKERDALSASGSISSMQGIPTYSQGDLGFIPKPENDSIPDTTAK